VKEKWLGTCTCGWSSGKLDSIGVVTEAYVRHTKLIEKAG
jgi:hypothetical protein